MGESGPQIREANPEVLDPTSAMTPRFNVFFRGFARRFFKHFDLADDTVDQLRELEARGSVVYVMRYASRLDYFLFNTLFNREGLRLSAFANGLSFYYYRPLLAGIKGWVARRRMSRKERAEFDRERSYKKVRQVSQSGESMFLFLRTARLADFIGGRKAAVEHGRREMDLLGEIVRTVWDGDHPVSLVPLALFWRKGPRAERRFLNLNYGSATRPSDFVKVTSFLATYRGLSVKVGEPIDLADFIEKRRNEGERAIVRKVRRSILLFLYREERVVEGPTLRPRHKVQEQVLGEPAVARAIEAEARESGSSPEAARAKAEKLFREIAANMSSTFLAILDGIVGALFRKLFVGIDPVGLDKVSDYAKRHPVVLVPSHRSYFDFLILSWMFYRNHLVPPHIAARENMAFGPFGFVFRRAGAFFLRRSFDDPLYKEVFRQYVNYLVREGFTQEFFIEGGRSRTGKSLAPRMGVLSWNIEAFIASGRRDLFFVPIAISYERLVEESSMVEELEGGEKKAESMLGLVRARSVLKRRFGRTTVNFGEPISLAKALGPDRAAFTGEETPEKLETRRVVTEALANDIVERINWAMVANATSVAACAILGGAERGLFRTELVSRMGEVMDLLRLQDVRFTPELLADEGEFKESIASLLRAGLIKAKDDPRGEILYYEASHRRALDVYRNGLFHFMGAPSLMARRLLRGATLGELRGDIEYWLDLLYAEFFAPKSIVMSLHIDAFLDYFERVGALAREDDRVTVTEKGETYLGFLAGQTQGLFEAYYAACSSLANLANLEEPLAKKQLEKLAEEYFDRAHLLGEVQRTEAWNPVTFGNALQLLTNRGILERAAEPARDRPYGPGPRIDELPALRERLAAALGAR